MGFKTARLRLAVFNAHKGLPLIFYLLLKHFMGSVQGRSQDFSKAGSHCQTEGTRQIVEFVPPEYCKLFALKGL